MTDMIEIDTQEEEVDEEIDGAPQQVVETDLGVREVGEENQQSADTSEEQANEDSKLKEKKEGENESKKEGKQQTKVRARQ
jgi:hypothetical protein